MMLDGFILNKDFLSLLDSKALGNHRKYEFVALKKS